MNLIYFRAIAVYLCVDVRLLLLCCSVNAHYCLDAVYIFVLSTCIDSIHAPLINGHVYCSYLHSVLRRHLFSAIAKAGPLALAAASNRWNGKRSFLPAGHTPSTIIMKRKYHQCLVVFSFTVAALAVFQFQSMKQSRVLEQPHSSIDKRSPLNTTNDTHDSEKDMSIPSSPQLAWLMSYPNSGTTFTLNHISAVSKLTMATNYKIDKPRPIHPVYRDQQEGPFWREPHDIKTCPNTTILVKTHCVHTGGESMIHTHSIERFIAGCYETRLGGASDRRGSYHGVSKVIHLIRNPFHNLIANYHFMLMNGQKALQSVQDFSRRCLQAKHDPPFLVNATTVGSTCQFRLIAYIVFHNQAFEVAARLGIPSLTIYYEDYQSDLRGTTQQVLDFLDLPFRGELLSFTPRLDYDDYFSTSDRASIKALAKQWASDKTWAAIEHYFE